MQTHGRTVITEQTHVYEVPTEQTCPHGSNCADIMFHGHSFQSLRKYFSWDLFITIFAKIEKRNILVCLSLNLAMQLPKTLVHFRVMIFYHYYLLTKLLDNHISCELHYFMGKKHLPLMLADVITASLITRRRSSLNLV